MTEVTVVIVAGTHLPPTNSFYSQGHSICRLACLRLSGRCFFVCQSVECRTLSAGNHPFGYASRLVAGNR